MLLIYIIIAILAFSYIVYLFIRKENNNNIWDYSMTFRGFMGALLLLIFMILNIIKILF